MMRMGHSRMILAQGGRINMTPEQQTGSGVRVRILSISLYASGYLGWAIEYVPDPNGQWLLTPTAGDCYSLIRM